MIEKNYRLENGGIVYNIFIKYKAIVTLFYFRLRKKEKSIPPISSFFPETKGKY